jgi:hypothetical protein
MELEDGSEMEPRTKASFMLFISGGVGGTAALSFRHKSPISRQTGHLRSSTHVDDYGVYQDLAWPFGGSRHARVA